MKKTSDTIVGSSADDVIGRIVQMGSVTKRKLVECYIVSGYNLKLTVYGGQCINCKPVRLVGDTLNYKDVNSMRYSGEIGAVIRSIPLSKVHKVKVLDE